MVRGHFRAPILEIEKGSESISLDATPWFFNDNGVPRYLSEPPPHALRIEVAPTDPDVAMGREYVVSEILSRKPDAPYGTETQLGILADRVTYEPMWATHAVVAAFGITLVKPGQAVLLESPVSQLAQNEYEYGVFAGHWSPYQNTGDRLLSIVISDLEHHDFPHVFASTDPASPLVITVGRYWPGRSILRLADLWVPRGMALYIPPKPTIIGQKCIDLHNNRNSARACWGELERSSVTTHTLLQPTGGYFHWYWNARDTNHSRPIESPHP